MSIFPFYLYCCIWNPKKKTKKQECWSEIKIESIQIHYDVCVDKLFSFSKLCEPNSINYTSYQYSIHLKYPLERFRRPKCVCLFESKMAQAAWISAMFFSFFFHFFVFPYFCMNRMKDDTCKRLTEWKTVNNMLTNTCTFLGHVCRHFFLKYYLFCLSPVSLR